jgi:hypothetical protein
LLRAEPASHWLEAFDVVADHFDYGCDGNGKNQAHWAPEPAPEKQCNCERERVEADAPADQRGHQQIRGDQVEERHHHDDADVRLNVLELLETDDDGREPRKNNAEIGNQVYEAGNERRKERELKPNTQEKHPAGEHQD